MFKISEFARIANVSVHLLRHYDDIGLFVPARIDKQSGYRYYSVEQLVRLHRIIALRELGLTLEQIARMLDDNIPDCEIQGMLRLRHQQVEQIIEVENARLRRIESRLKQIQQHKMAPDYDIVLKSAPEMDILSTGHITISDADATAIVIEAGAKLKQRDALETGYSMALVHDFMTDCGLHNIEIGYHVKHDFPDGLRLNSGRLLTSRRLDAVETIATVIHHGARVNNSQAYQSIFTWMEANNYQYLAGELPREHYHLGTNHDDDPQNIVEVQIPIIKI